jgi:hypothetical protein
MILAQETKSLKPPQLDLDTLEIVPATAGTKCSPGDKISQDAIQSSRSDCWYFSSKSGSAVVHLLCAYLLSLNAVLHGVTQ